MRRIYKYRIYALVIEAVFAQCEFANFVFNRLSSFNLFGLQFRSKKSNINQVVLKIYSQFYLLFFNPRIWINGFKKSCAIFGHGSPLPTISLGYSARRVGIIRYVSAECVVKPVYKFLISICNSYLKPMARNFIISVRCWFTNSYYNGTFSVKQTRHIANCINVFFPYHAYKHIILCSNSQRGIL